MAQKPMQKTVTVLEKGKVTPIGKAMWCKIVRPDTKFDENGDYKTDLILEGQAAQDLIEVCDAAGVTYQKEIKKPVTKMPYEAVIGDDGEETGEVKFKFKMKATSKYGPRRPAVFDSTGKQLTTPPEVGNGSDIRIKFNLKGYKLGPGISLELVGVQIVNLVEFGGSAGGMDAVEGGYTAGSQSNDEEEETTGTEWD